LVVKIIGAESLPTRSENPGERAPAREDGVCGSEAPALATVGGRLVLVGTGYALDDVIAALERGERPPGLSDVQVALAESAAVEAAGRRRGPGAAP
jgi:hypothetical protein